MKKIAKIPGFWTAGLILVLTVPQYGISSATIPGSTTFLLSFDGAARLLHLLCFAQLLLTIPLLFSKQLPYTVSHMANLNLLIALLAAWACPLHIVQSMGLGFSTNDAFSTSFGWHYWLMFWCFIALPHLFWIPAVRVRPPLTILILLLTQLGNLQLFVWQIWICKQL